MRRRKVKRKFITREQIKSAVKRYLDNGGKITKIDTVPDYDSFMKFNIDNSLIEGFYDQQKATGLHRIRIADQKHRAINQEGRTSTERERKIFTANQRTV